jgi:hypothetical protein
MKRIIINNIVEYFNEARKYMLEVLNRDSISNVAIWGAGLSGKIVFHLLEESDIIVENFYDSYKRGEFLNLKIINPYKELKNTPVIIASSKPIEQLKKIVEYLERKRVPFYFTSKIENKNRKLLNFKNIHKNKRCFVIGNGPSLNQIDMNKLQNEITIGANRIYLGFKKWKLNLKYWTIEDELVAKDIAFEWNQLKDVIKFIPDDLIYLVDNFDNVINFNFKREDFEEGLPRFSDEWCELYWGGTVTYLMLQLAAIIGCNPIYMIGVDFSYKKPEHITYGKSEIEWISHGDDPNHFHPDYFGKGRKWHDPRLDRMEKAYISAKNFFDKKGIKVYNATPGTKLKIFPLVDYNDLFER